MATVLTAATLTCVTGTVNVSRVHYALVWRVCGWWVGGRVKTCGISAAPAHDARASSLSVE